MCCRPRGPSASGPTLFERRAGGRAAGVFQPAHHRHRCRRQGVPAHSGRDRSTTRPGSQLAAGPWGLSHHQASTQLRCGRPELYREQTGVQSRSCAARTVIPRSSGTLTGSATGSVAAGVLRHLMPTQGNRSRLPARVDGDLAGHRVLEADSLIIRDSANAEIGVTLANPHRPWNLATRPPRRPGVLSRATWHPSPATEPHPAGATSDRRHPGATSDRRTHTGDPIGSTMPFLPCSYRGHTEFEPVPMTLNSSDPDVGSPSRTEILTMSVRRILVGLALVASTLVGGAVGAVVIGGGFANAQTSTPTPTPGAANGQKFTPNEDATHEQGESAAREAQENAGQVPTVP